MAKLNSLILLIKSLSKSEKRMVRLRSQYTDTPKVYLALFQLIDQRGVEDSRQLSQLLKKKHPNAFLPAVCAYLYNFILKVLVDVKQENNANYNLYYQIGMANILHDLNLYNDYLHLLEKVKLKCKELENYNLLLICQRMELDFLLKDGFQGYTEKELYNKQSDINETLKTIRQINEQSTLYELLRFYLERSSGSQSLPINQLFNDLVVSEISLVSNLKYDVFEISKLHQLFQAHYLISAGDYKAALNSFIELDNLFENNKKLWNDPPVYYVMVLEGVLESLRRIKAYDQLPYFLGKLKQLAHSSVYFKLDVLSIEFFYTLIPSVDSKDFSGALPVINLYAESLLNKKKFLNPHRDLQISLYASIVYFMTDELVLARKQLSHITKSNSYADIWLFRPLQLINLMIYYRLGEFDYVSSVIRANKRYNQKKSKYRESAIEILLFRFLTTDLTFISPHKKEVLKQKYEEAINNTELTGEDHRLLSIFDFSAWMISQLSV